MRVCPKCHAQYDDSWAVCLKCSAALEAVAPTAVSGEELAVLARSVNGELQKLSARLEAIERKVGIETKPSERAAEITAPRAAAPAATPARAGTLRWRKTTATPSRSSSKVPRRSKGSGRSPNSRPAIK